MKTILFICAENSTRSQMAEAFAKMHGNDKVHAYSAGTKPSGLLNEKAIESMKSKGYDLTSHKSKSIDEFIKINFDQVITMGLNNDIPFILSRHHEDWDIPDPIHLDENDFNVVRDLIELRVKQLIANIDTQEESKIIKTPHKPSEIWIGKKSESKHLKQSIAFNLFRFLSLAVVSILFLILSFIVFRGAKVISWEFLTTAPEEGMTKGGIFPAIVGTFYLVLGSMLFAFPIGVLSAIYINEYTKAGFFKRFVKLMTNNLAGIPSIVFGLFGMSLFVNTLKFGDSILAGSLTLGLLTLPVVIRTTEEALWSVENSFRHGSLALGATKLQTIRRVVLPMAFPNIITGLILSIGRVSGETAPILFTVAAYFLTKLPSSIFDQVMALPYHLYVICTSGTNMTESRPMAYGTALVLISIVLIVNVLANGLRRYFAKKVKMH